MVSSSADSDESAAGAREFSKRFNGAGTLVALEASMLVCIGFADALRWRTKKVECPHCLTTVLVMTDKKCPSCGGICSDVEVANNRRTKVTFVQGEDPGDHCLVCARVTPERKSFTRVADNENYTASAGDAVSSLLIGGAFTRVLNWAAGKGRHVVRVKIPLCGSCGRTMRVQPYSVDFENRSMTFVGDRACRENLEQVRDASNGG